MTQDNSSAQLLVDAHEKTARLERIAARLAASTASIAGELEIIGIHVDKLLDEMPMIERQRSRMADIKVRCAAAIAALAPPPAQSGDRT